MKIFLNIYLSPYHLHLTAVNISDTFFQLERISYAYTFRTLHSHVPIVYLSDIEKSFGNIAQTLLMSSNFLHIATDILNVSLPAIGFALHLWYIGIFNMKYMPTDFPVCTLYKLVGSRKNQQHCSIWLIWFPFQCIRMPKVLENRINQKLLFAARLISIV